VHLEFLSIYFIIEKKTFNPLPPHEERGKSFFALYRKKL
jgi:hypothetical protein